MNNEEKNCSTCRDEDTDKDQYPCDSCDPRWFSNWSPKTESENDLWDM